MVTTKIRRLVIFGLAALCVITFLSVKYYKKIYLVNRLAGASVSSQGQWPWQVSIHKHVDGKKHFKCGGALIGTKWVLTAAHCVYDKNYEYTFIAGDYNINIKDSTEQERKALNTYIHQEYNDDYFTLGYDIALIELAQDVTLGPCARTISLPEREDLLSTPNTKGWVAGWGYQDESIPKASNILRHASFTIQSKDLCADSFNKKLTFCAGDGKGVKGFCNGDSGGPFVRKVLRNGQKQWVAIGLVSGSAGCAKKGNYDYYTRLEPFVDWIKGTREPIRPTTPSRAFHNHIYLGYIFLLSALTFFSFLT